MWHLRSDWLVIWLVCSWRTSPVVSEHWSRKIYFLNMKEETQMAAYVQRCNVKKSYDHFTTTEAVCLEGKITICNLNWHKTAKTKEFFRILTDLHNWIQKPNSLDMDKLIDKQTKSGFSSCTLEYLLDLLVDYDAHSMLGNIVHTACFPMVTLMRHTLLNGTCALWT